MLRVTRVYEYRVGKRIAEIETHIARLRELDSGGGVVREEVSAEALQHRLAKVRSLLQQFMLSDSLKKKQELMSEIDTRLAELNRMGFA